MDRIRIIARMKKISEGLAKAYKWVLVEIATGPSKEAIEFTEDLDAVLKKWNVYERKL